MSSSIEAIDKQIGKCKCLMAIFISERHYFREREKIKIKDLLVLHAQKINLINDLDRFKKIVQETDTELEIQPASADERPQKIRELSDLLEQLLIIEHENELLFKQIVTQSAVPPTPSTTDTENRRYAHGYAPGSGKNRISRHVPRRDAGVRNPLRTGQSDFMNSIRGPESNV